VQSDGFSVAMLRHSTIEDTFGKLSMARGYCASLWSPLPEFYCRRVPREASTHPHGDDTMPETSMAESGARPNLGNGVAQHRDRPAMEIGGHRAPEERYERGRQVDRAPFTEVSRSDPGTREEREAARGVPTRAAEWEWADETGLGVLQRIEGVRPLHHDVGVAAARRHGCGGTRSRHLRDDGSPGSRIATGADRLLRLAAHHFITGGFDDAIALTAPDVQSESRVAERRQREDLHP